MTVQAAFAATLVDEWVRAGVRHAVLAPGSRSTPLALALADAADRLRLHVHLDERSAAFFALGLGLATRRPAVLLTTSGTAAVEAHPAVVEAWHAGVPLLVCTADRPPELHDVGAPQTVDQARLYGRAVRWFCDPGVPDAAGAPAWRSVGARTAAEAMAGPGGPVQLNLPFREPLVGVAEPRSLPEGRADGAPWHTASRSRRALDSATLQALLPARRGLVVAGRGAGNPTAVIALAQALGWPVLADPLSGCRLPAPPGSAVVGAFDALLRHRPFADRQRPDVVIRLGAPPASKALASWLGEAGALQAVVASGAWLDPERAAALVVDAEPEEVCAVLGELGHPADEAWARSWAVAEALAQDALDRALSAFALPTEPGVARGVADCLPPGSRLVVSSSMPVRDLEWYARPRPGLEVFANRGANGIDGVVSTALGVAAAGGPVVALLGDLAFLHDAGGLLGAARRGLDCTLVVVDNDGGGIFSFLPQARALEPARFEALFGTPHGVDLGALAAVHGIPVVTPQRAAEVAAAVRSCLEAGGVRVIHIRTDRAANVAVHDELHAAVAAALQRHLPEAEGTPGGVRDAGGADREVRGGPMARPRR